MVNPYLEFGHGEESEVVSANVHLMAPVVGLEPRLGLETPSVLEARELLSATLLSWVPLPPTAAVFDQFRSLASPRELGSALVHRGGGDAGGDLERSSAREFAFQDVLELALEAEGDLDTMLVQLLPLLSSKRLERLPHHCTALLADGDEVFVVMPVSVDDSTLPPCFNNRHVASLTIRLCHGARLPQLPLRSQGACLLGGPVQHFLSWIRLSDVLASPSSMGRTRPATPNGTEPDVG